MVTPGAGLGCQAIVAGCKGALLLCVLLNIHIRYKEESWKWLLWSSLMMGAREI